MPSRYPLAIVGGLPQQNSLESTKVKDGQGSNDAASLGQLPIVLMTSGGPGAQEDLYDADGSVMTHYDPAL